MKKILGIAILGVIFAVPAHAQHSMAAVAGPNGPGYIEGGTAGSGGTGGGGAGGKSSFHTLPQTAPKQFDTIGVSGTESEFVPSSWTQFEQGLAEGRALLATQRKTLGEIADENRLVEKPKAKLTIIQDANGRAIIQRR
jgi:hypothetical protein